MKCFKCNKVFSNISEVSDHMKIEHGVSGKKDFNCLQCEQRFEDLSVFKSHLKTCKKVSSNDLRTESYDLKMFSGETDVQTTEGESDCSAGVLTVNSCQTNLIIESEDSDCEMICDTGNIETGEYEQAEGEPDIDGLARNNDQSIQNNESKDSEDYEIVSEDESEPDGTTGESDQLQFKSILASWGVTPLYENLIACGINSENMCYLDNRDLYIILGDEKHLLGYMVKFRHLLRQYSVDSTSNRSNKLKKKPTFVNILNILQQSDEGRSFINNYQRLKLNVKLRCQLVRIILKETFSKNMTLSRSCLSDMAIQICKIFTKEEKSVYYHKLKKQPPTGILYTKYINMRHAQLKREQQVASNETNNVSETVEIAEEEGEMRNEAQADALDTNGELDQCSTDNMESSLKLIKDYTQGCDKELLLEHWKKTFKHRQEKMKEYVEIDEIFVDWPPLKQETGHALLCIDFVLEYGIDTSNGLNKWNSFFEENLANIGRIIKDPLIKRQLNGLDSSTNLEAKNKTIIMALHHLLIPARTIVKKEHWKPTISMSQQSFIKVVNGEQVMRTDMAKREKFCKSYGMKSHPVIFEITTCMGTRYKVCIKDVSYKVGSLLEGVDVAYKMFKLLNIEFPLECRKVWKFIEHVFYVEDNNISGELLSIIMDMNKE